MRIYKESGENCIEHSVVRGNREETRGVNVRLHFSVGPAAFLLPVGSAASLILNPTCNYAIRHQRWKSAGSRLGAAAERLFVCFPRVGTKAAEREELGQANRCLVESPAERRYLSFNKSIAHAYSAHLLCT